MHPCANTPTVQAPDLRPYDLSRTAEVSINGALAPPHPCLSTPQTLPLSSLGPPDKLPPCLKVGHYRPPEHHRAPHWALIAISSLAAPPYSTGGQEVDGEFSTVDSRMKLFSCLLYVPIHTSATPCPIVPT